MSTFKVRFSVFSVSDGSGTAYFVTTLHCSTSTEILHCLFHLDVWSRTECWSGISYMSVFFKASPNYDLQHGVLLSVFFNQESPPLPLLLSLIIQFQSGIYSTHPPTTPPPLPGWTRLLAALRSILQTDRQNKCTWSSSSLIWDLLICWSESTWAVSVWPISPPAHRHYWVEWAGGHRHQTIHKNLLGFKTACYFSKQWERDWNSFFGHY